MAFYYRWHLIASVIWLQMLSRNKWCLISNAVEKWVKDQMLLKEKSHYQSVDIIEIVISFREHQKGISIHLQNSANFGTFDWKEWQSKKWFIKYYFLFNVSTGEVLIYMEWSILDS
jgi:hypothetical protein